MNLFESVKAAVTVRQAAEHYGLEVNRGNMVCCPFHNDRIPSMKLNEDYFYCFGCGAHGDVIDLVARLFNLNSYDAAHYDRFLRRDMAAYQQMYELICPAVRHKTVLELATGTGLIASHIINAADTRRGRNAVRLRRFLSAVG